MFSGLRADYPYLVPHFQACLEGAVPQNILIVWLYSRFPFKLDTSAPATQILCSSLLAFNSIWIMEANLFKIQIPAFYHATFYVANYYQLHT